MLFSTFRGDASGIRVIGFSCPSSFQSFAEHLLVSARRIQVDSLIRRLEAVGIIFADKLRVYSIERSGFSAHRADDMLQRRFNR